MGNSNPLGNMGNMGNSNPFGNMGNMGNMGNSNPLGNMGNSNPLGDMGNSSNQMFDTMSTNFGEGLGKMGQLGSQMTDEFLNPKLISGFQTGMESLGSKLSSSLVKFNKNISKNAKKTANSLNRRSDVSNDVKKCLPNLPALFFPSLFYEFNIPLNLNDVLLMSFSVFPYIGWIFDIFMIFRALLEKRWLYAVLMVINWYQWFFWKIMSFGMLNIDLGPLFKLYYVGPYATEYFNLSNITSTFLHFLSELTGNMPKMIQVIS